MSFKIKEKGGAQLDYIIHNLGGFNQLSLANCNNNTVHMLQSKMLWNVKLLYIQGSVDSIKKMLLSLQRFIIGICYCTSKIIYDYSKMEFIYISNSWHTVASVNV